MLQATGSRAVNYDDAPGTIDTSRVPKSGNPVYYVRTDGAATKANATAPSSASGAMSLATFNGESFSPGDIIEFDGRGASPFGQITIPSGGSPGAPITYRGSVLYPPTISVSAGAHGILVSAKSDVDIGFFPDIQQTDGDAAGVLWQLGSKRNRIQSVAVLRNRNAGGTVAGDCFSVNNDSHVIGRDLMAKDFKDGGTGSDQAFTTHDTCTFDVYGFDVENGNHLAVPVGTSRLRLFGGFARDMAVGMGTADSAAGLEIHDSTLLVDNGGGLPKASSTTASTKIAGCRLIVTNAGQNAFEGTLLFSDSVIDFDTDGRWTLNNQAAVFAMTGCRVNVGNANFTMVRQIAGGAIQVERSLFDCAGGQSNDRVFDIDGGPSALPQYIRDSVFKNFDGMAAAVRVQELDGTAALLIENVTFWNQTDAGVAIDNNRTDAGASLTIRNTGFQNVLTSVDGSANATIEFCGFRAAGAVLGTNGVDGDPAMLDPANSDFTLGASSAWRGQASDDGDIGAGLVF